MKKKHQATEPPFAPLLTYEEVMQTKCPGIELVVSSLRMSKKDAIDILALANTLLQSMQSDSRQSSMSFILSQLSKGDRELLRPLLNSQRALLSTQALELALYRLALPDYETHCISKQEYRYSLLQLILCANDDFIARVNPQIGQRPELSVTLATVTASQSEYVWPFNLFVHLYRAVHMIHELDGRESYQDYIQKYFCVAEPMEAVKVMISALFRTLMHDPPSYKVIVSSQYETVREALNTRCINNVKASVKGNFNDLRQCPLYYSGEGEYIVLSPIFLLQLLFSGTLFHYKNNGLPVTSENTSNLSEMLQLTLLRKAVRELYPNCHIYDGDELDLDGMVGSKPDAVIVTDKCVFIVELKSGVLSDKVKQSSDPDLFVSELVKKYVQNEKRSLGLLQAHSYHINSLAKLFDTKGHNIAGLKCILLLVHDDPALIAPGIVDILEREYEARGMPPGVGLIVHVNTVVHLSISERDSGDDILELTRRYRSLHKRGMLHEKMISFDEFILKNYRFRLSLATVHELAAALNLNPVLPT